MIILLIMNSVRVPFLSTCCGMHPSKVAWILWRHASGQVGHLNLDQVYDHDDQKMSHFTDQWSRLKFLPQGLDRRARFLRIYFALRFFLSFVTRLIPQAWHAWTPGGNCVTYTEVCRVLQKKMK